VQQLQQFTAAQCGRLLRILFVWFDEVPTNSGAAWLL
jgi:hypothetical protein